MQSIRDAIISAKDPWPGDKIDRKIAGPQVNQVLGGLYLGNDGKFVEIVPVTLTKKGSPIDTTNPHKFECALSVCSYTRMVRAIPDLGNYPAETIDRLLKEKKIEWVQMGRAIPDDKMAWTDLVFNATFPDSELAQKEIEIPRDSQEPEHVALRMEKRAIVKKTPVAKWFERAFEILDQAVLGNRKTLVNCHWGASRTGALVAAYLINRYDVTPEQAIAFLRTKRNCINPKCIDDLQNYARALKG